jgi:hypothetical protein
MSLLVERAASVRRWRTTPVRCSLSAAACPHQGIPWSRCTTGWDGCSRDGTDPRCVSRVAALQARYRSSRPRQTCARVAGGWPVQRAPVTLSSRLRPWVSLLILVSWSSGGHPPRFGWRNVHLRQTSSRCHLSTVSDWTSRATLRKHRYQGSVFACSRVVKVTSIGFSVT